MDQTERINRLLSTGLSALGAMAITATLLNMIQDSPEVSVIKSNRKEKPKDSNEVIPKIGEGTDLFPDFVQGLIKLSEKARNSSSHGLGYIDNFGTKQLLLTNPEHCRYVLSKITAHALWGGIKPASEAFFGRSVLFVLEGEEWKKLRGLLRDSFKMQKLEVLSLDVTQCAFELSNRLQDYAESNQEIDVQSAFAQYHLACVGKSSFNYDLNVLQKFPEPNDVSASFEYLLQELPRRSFHPDLKVQTDYKSPTEDNIKWTKAAQTVRRVVTKTIEQRLDEEKKGTWISRGDLLDQMIASYRSSSSATPNSSNSSSTTTTTTESTKREAEILTDALGDNLVEIFFAGYNTSTVTMSTALYYLAHNKDLMRRAQREVDAVDMEQRPALSAKQFPYLCQVFNEALRLVPPAPLLARFTTEDLQLDDVNIPTGTNVWFPVGFLHTDPQSWGSTVDKFDPSRWEKPTKPGSFIPFSDGPRICIGKYFAELESVVALAVLLNTYDFDVSPNFEFYPLFTGFGTRVANGKDMKVCCKLIPRRRIDSSVNLYDWTPGKIVRKNSSNPFV